MRPILIRQLPRPEANGERRGAPRSYVYQTVGCRVFPDTPGSVYGNKKVLGHLRDFSSTGFGFRDFCGEMLRELEIGGRYIIQLSWWWYGKEVERLFFYGRFVHRSTGVLAPRFPGVERRPMIGVLGFEIEQYPLGDEDLPSRLV